MTSRAQKWRLKLCPNSPYRSIDLKLSPYDKQIKLDIVRTYPQNKWFFAHREKLRYILNTFSILNSGFGYTQGLNFLCYTLYYVYYNDNAKHVDMDTLYSLQTLVHVVLPLYPVDKNDTCALKRIRQFTNLICFKCYEIENKLHFLLDLEYEPFMISLVSHLVPTFFASVFPLEQTICIWDILFQKDSLKNILQGLVEMIVGSITYHKNIFIYLPIHTSMEVFHTVLRESAEYLIK
jgi:hypothetical protein